MPKPKSIIFFPNGLTAVCDENGEQMPEYQRAKDHEEAINLLGMDGYNWASLEVTGYPLLPMPDYSRVTEPTTATRATLRDLLQAQVAALELAPKWLWEIEFALHIWPILERFHRERDGLAVTIVESLMGTASVTAGVLRIIEHLNEGNGETPPW